MGTFYKNSTYVRNWSTSYINDVDVSVWDNGSYVTACHWDVISPGQTVVCERYYWWWKSGYHQTRGDVTATAPTGAHYVVSSYSAWV